MRVARAMKDDYQDFLDEYMLGSSRMIEAAASGYRLDPGRCLPDGSFPPAVIESLLRWPEVSTLRRLFPPDAFQEPDRSSVASCRHHRVHHSSGQVT